MKRNTLFSKTCRRLSAALGCLVLLSSFAACSDVLEHLILRDEETLPEIDSNLLHVDPAGSDESDTDPAPDIPRYPFNGSQIHPGTGIAHTAPDESPYKAFCVIIDAGHQATANDQTEPIGPGGEQTAVMATVGHVGAYTRQTEHGLNLAVALSMRNELCARGYNVVMVRETADVRLSDRERAELANEVAEKFEYTVYIRIHAAVSENAEERGAMVLYPSEKNPYPTCASHAEQSRSLSEWILERYCKGTPHARKHEEPLRENDSLTATNWSRVPTCAVVLGFLSHEVEDTAMSYGDFRTRAGESIADGIDAYFRDLTAPDRDDLPVTVEVTEAPPEPDTEPADPPEAGTESETVEEPDVDTVPETLPETAAAPEMETAYAVGPVYSFDEDKMNPGVNIHYAAIADSPHATQCVVIDAGHQLTSNKEQEPNGPGSSLSKIKITAGTTGMFTGQSEAMLNLQVALYLRNELYARGYNVVMIRESASVDISNAERAKLANAYRAIYDEVILIRIHGNGSENPDATGSLVMCQSSKNPYPTCAAHYEESRELSLSILGGYEKKSGILRRENFLIETDAMTGINWSEVPATILEMGFLTNERDDRLMETDAFRRNAAIGIADGVDLYFKT